MLSKLLKVVCVAICSLAVSATSDEVTTQVGAREVAGSLSLLIHSLELNKQLEYCVLTPNDDSNSELIVIDVEHNPGMLEQCEQGAEGLFTIAQSSTSSKKMDKSGCDSRFAPLCVPAAYEVVQSQMFEFSGKQKQNKAAMDKVVGARSALVIEMDYLDRVPDCNMACLQQSMWTSTYTVDGMYNEASYGTLRFSQASSQLIQLKMSSRVSDYDYCANGPQKIRTDALAELSVQYPNIVPSNFNHMIMSSPALCGVAVSQVGGTLVWMNSNAPDVLGHELGHNLGRRHASLDTTDDDPSTQTSYSTDQDYGDLSCMMGYSGVGMRSFTVPARILLGWIPSSSIAIPPATCSNTAVQYTLASAQLPADNTYGYHAVQIPRAKGGRYYISFRSGAGYDVNAPTGWKNAVFVHYTVGVGARTKFVAALTSGQSYSDSVSGFRVSVVSLGSNSATVSVVCGANVANCNINVATSAMSSIAGQFIQSTSTVNGTSAWARSDMRAVIAYCGSKSIWVIGSHDGSAITNFSPCAAIIYKSSSSSQASPTDSDTWYSCSSSSCSTDSSAALSISSCTQVAAPVAATPSPSPSSSPSRSLSSSPSRSLSSSPSRSLSSIPSSALSSSPSSTLSSSPSNSFSSSSSSSPSRSSSSASPSCSSSLFASPSKSMTMSPSSTKSMTMSPSATKSRTSSSSVSRSSSSTSSSSKTSSKSASPTKSASRTSSASRSTSVSASIARSPSPSPSSSTGTAAAAVIENLAVITALDASSTPVCPYFESLCSKCEHTPSAICAYLTDLCEKCT